MHRLLAFWLWEENRLQLQNPEEENNVRTDDVWNVEVGILVSRKNPMHLEELSRAISLLHSSIAPCSLLLCSLLATLQNMLKDDAMKISLISIRNNELFGVLRGHCPRGHDTQYA